MLSNEQGIVIAERLLADGPCHYDELAKRVAATPEAKAAGGVYPSLGNACYYAAHYGRPRWRKAPKTGVLYLEGADAGSVAAAKPTKEKAAERAVRAEARAAELEKNAAEQAAALAELRAQMAELQAAKGKQG